MGIIAGAMLDRENNADLSLIKQEIPRGRLLI